MGPISSLVMYDVPEIVRDANDLFWAAIRDHLRGGGFSAPEQLSRDAHYHDYWLMPDLVLAQTCGFPYVKELIGKVRLVGTPVYCFAGGEGALRGSFVVVRDVDPARTLEDLRNRVVAINDGLSNSGMNLLRAAIAPLARDGRFFSDIVMTGGHVASIEAVSQGRADVAAIDSVTWGLLDAHAPERVEGLRILAETPKGPGLPYITRHDASDAELDALRRAIVSVIADPAHRQVIETIGLVRIEMLDDQDYALLSQFEQDAIRLGYPNVA